ncbi:MAG TPA: hypothetical protein VF173_16845 [Thermoanaerobaculia bacterium]|nr:hypothetical protein [Thermoanaerobaculia bacterium]
MFLAVCLASPSLLAAEAKAPSVLEMRLVADEAGTDTEEMTVPLTRPRPDAMLVVRESLHVQKASLLKTTLDSVTLENDLEPGKWAVTLTVSESGRERLAEVTGQNVGKRMAILIDGKVLLAPRNQSAMLDGRIMVTGQFSKEEATDLAAKITPVVRK